MTYCLGWKTQTCAYLVADSAVTSPRVPSTLRSSFGELHATGARENVEEGALKIISAPGAGITFAGDATIGFAVADTFRMALAVGVTPREALQRAIDSNVDSGNRVDLSVLCAFVEHGQPHLLSFNRDRDRRFVEHAAGDLVQLGSLVGKGNFLCQISDTFIGHLKKSDLNGAAPLGCALGLCQSYGIRNALLAHGVGGAFVGAFVDGSGFHWQPDMAYQLAAPGGAPDYPSVFSFIRDDVLIVRSLLADGPPRIFMNSLGEPDESSNARARRVDQQCLAALRDLQFEYLVFLNTAIPIVAVVQMARRAEHRYVILHPLQPPSPEGKALMPMSVCPPVSSFIMATDAEGPEPGLKLGAMLYYWSYLHPSFDIRHVGFEVEFFGDDEEGMDLPEYTMASYESAKDTAPIFFQSIDHIGFGAAHLLKWYLDIQDIKLENCIPEHAKKSEGNVFTITFPISFTEGTFYMDTANGCRDIKRLKLLVEITWLPVDPSRPRVGDLSGFSKLSLGPPTA